MSKILNTKLLKHAVKQGMVIGIGTVFLSTLVSLSSQAILSYLGPLTLKFILLIVIILIGVIFDIIGVAAAVANESPFHARAATKALGAKQAVRIVRNGDRVASFSNDVVGDISGILSGAIGAAIVFELLHHTSQGVLIGTLMTSLIAGLTVGGKAMGKSLAIEHANDIVLRVGMLLALIENTTGIRIFGDGRKKGRK